MAEEEEFFSLLTLKDFEETGIDIGRKWTRLEALMAVASLASDKLEQESIIHKEKEKSTASCLDQGGVFECGSSSRSCNDPRTTLARVSDETAKEREKALKKPVTYCNLDFVDLYSKKGLQFSDITPNKLLGDAMKAGIGVAESEQKGSKSKRKPKREKENVLNVTPDDLPGQFRERIEQLNGSKIGLVIQKHLYEADLSDRQRRLSIPMNQIKSPDFLTDNEKRHLQNKGEMKVKFIDPLLQEYDGMIFKLRRMSKFDANKKEIAFCLCYVFIKEWINVKNRNKLELDDEIQLWKFRSPIEELCFALVLVDRNNGRENKSS
ncbi:hypothetical protein AB3S75_010527 [Citrus x aurantiifolia]